MSNLRDFQRAAVNRIVAMLNSNGSRRFLLADEVGLGKTLITKGVIEKLSESKKTFTVVYLCSNMEIAAQNADKLAPSTSSSRPVKERLTLMCLADSFDRKAHVRIYSFTPGTSLNLGNATGVMRERRLLLHLISTGFGQRLGNRWRTFFQCGARDRDGWKKSTSSYKLHQQFSAHVRPAYRRRWAKLVRHGRLKLLVDPKQESEYNLLDGLRKSVIDFANQPNVAWIKTNRCRIIGELRKCMAVAALDSLSPNLVVMDEFQRFKEILDNSRSQDSIEAQLLAKSDAKVLILSATPYKLYTKQHEKEDHHKDFLDTYAFLNNCEIDDQKVSHLKENLASFRKGLEAINPKEPIDEQLMEKKRAIETDLRNVMCRTERNRYIEDARKGITEIPTDGEANSDEIPRESELKQYLELSQFLLRNQKIAQDYGHSIMDYWKSGPSLLSFMDSHYSLIQKLRDPGQRDHGQRVPPHLLLSESKLRSSAGSNFKFRQLFKQLFGKENDTQKDAKDTHWPFLWIKPTHTYYKDTFFGERAPSKMLVFSHWNFVPKTIAFLTSTELERRIKFSKEEFSSSPLTFGKSRMSIFNVAFPSLALATRIDVLKCCANGSGENDRRMLERVARQKLLDLLQETGVQYKRSGKTKEAWQIIAAIEAAYCNSKGTAFVDEHRLAIRQCRMASSSSEHNHSDWFQIYIEKYCDWLDKAESSQTTSVNEDTVREILAIALYSPANNVLRTLLRARDDIFPDTETGCDKEIDLFTNAAAISVEQVRNYFNRSIVQCIIQRHAKGKRYVDKVLDYCARAHLQAVIDEFVYLQIPNIFGDSTTSKAQRLVEHLGSVFSMHAGSPRINVSDGGRLKTDSRINCAAHFALAFADDTHVESDGQAEYRSRKSDVRNAFNSPFWPFVLATTSVGQEGLDFHLYCKDIVHWNLPSNPVDLEQREGRLNRFNSLAIREMIAKDYPLQSLSKCPKPSDIVENRGLPWQWTFDEIYSQPLSQQMFKQGLFPHWVYSPRDGKMEILRRHLMFYSNSRDVQKYKQLKRDLSIYRLVFGQPRQEDVVRKIRENLGGDVSDELLNQFLPIYMINLSPFDSKDVWHAAQSEASKIIKNLATLTQFIGMVKTFVTPRNIELQEVKEEIANLIRIAEQATLGAGHSAEATVLAVAALYYLINPYDEIYDFHTGVGFKDDIELIKRVSAELLRMET